LIKDPFLSSRLLLSKEYPSSARNERKAALITTRCS